VHSSELSSLEISLLFELKAVTRNKYSSSSWAN